MKKHLQNEFNRTLEMRKRRVEELMEYRRKYISSGEANQFLLDRFDDEIKFALKAVKELEQI